MTRIPTLSPRPVPLASGVTSLHSSNLHVRIVIRCPRFPRLGLEPSIQVQLHDEADMGDAPHRHLPANNTTSISVSRRQGRIPSSGPFPIVPKLELRFLRYGWEPFLDTRLQKGNGESPEIPVTPASSVVIEINNGSPIQVNCNRFVEVVFL